MRGPRPLTTALSHPNGDAARVAPRGALARSSQGAWGMFLVAALGSLASPGCLIAEAPSYDAPRRTVPVIDSVDPTPSLQLEILPNTEKPFTFRVYSEDAGEPLVAYLVIDYNAGKREEMVDAVDIPARAADEPKNVKLVLLPDDRRDNGCHSLTALVMHRSSATAAGRPKDPASRDVASVTWWIELDTGSGAPRVECPTGQ